MIVKVPPGLELSDVQEELAAVIQGSAEKPECRRQISYPTHPDHAVGGTPYETRFDTPEFRQLIKAIKSVRPRAEMSRPRRTGHSSFPANIDVPGVYWGPGDISICHTPEENVSIYDYRDGILALSIFPRRLTRASEQAVSKEQSDGADPMEGTGLFLAALFIAGPARAQETISPDGEKPVGSDQLKLNDADLKALKAGKFKAALLWHVQSDFMAAVAQGAKDELKALGIDVVAETDANLDAAKQQNDVETVMAKAPNMIITIPLDPVGVLRQPSLNQATRGVKLSFLAAVPKDYKAGKDYVALTTDDLFHDGEKAAHALAEAIGGKGEIGYIYFDANLYVPNERDKAFKYTIEHKYPDIKIVASQGIVDPLKAQEAADAFASQAP